MLQSPPPTSLTGQDHRHTQHAQVDPGSQLGSSHGAPVCEAMPYRLYHRGWAQPITLEAKDQLAARLYVPYQFSNSTQSK